MKFIFTLLLAVGPLAATEPARRPSTFSLPIPSSRTLCASILAKGGEIKTVKGSVPILFPNGTPLFDPRDLKFLESVIESPELAQFLAEQGIAIDPEHARQVSGGLPRGAVASTHATLLGLERVIDILVPAHRDFFDPKVAILAAGQGYHPICHPPGPKGVPVFFNPAFHWIVDLNRAKSRMTETSFASEIQTTFRDHELSVTWNTDFAQVMRKTAEMRAATDDRRRLSPVIVEMYQHAFTAGQAYSIEVWRRVQVDGHLESRMVAGTFGFSHAGLVTIEDGFTDLSTGKAWDSGQWVDDVLGEDAGRIAILSIIDRLLASGDAGAYQLRMSDVNALTNILDPQPMGRAQSVSALKELRRVNRFRGQMFDKAGRYEIDWSHW